VRTGEPQRQADAVARALREGMQTILDEHQVEGVAYGESSVFHVFFGEGVRGSIEGLSAERIRSVPKETVVAYQQGLRKRGVDFMSYLGGVTSSAHSEADVGPTLEAFEGTIRELIADRRIGRH
jgi:glutamate-1-semialdehyde 2,1-aminomutase